jgi:tetratricopeptide (TPR) repeat protein
LVVVLTASATAFAAEDLPMVPEAYEHLKKGLDAYKAKDYDRAVVEFEAGYALEPRKEFLFAWAQAERLRGRCAKAIDLYQRYIDSGPSESQMEAARVNQQRCREALAQPVPTPAPPPPPPSEGSAGDDDRVGAKVRGDGAAGALGDRDGERRTTSPAWWRDPWGAGLVGLGVVSLGVGLGYQLAAGTSEDAANRAATYDDYAHFLAESGDRRTVSAVAYGAGAALVVAGVVRYAIVGRAEHGEAARGIGVVPERGARAGASLVVWGTW